MTETEKQVQSDFAPQADVVRINLEAGAWIERRDFGDWSEKDRQEFEAWLDAAPEHRVAYLRLDAGWQRGEIMVALRPLQTERSVPNKTRGLPLLGRIAGAFVLVLAIGAMATVYLTSPPARDYATGIGGRQTVMFADGSQIELNTNTALRIADESNQRTVWLDKGEAFFQVKHDATRPLVVKTGGYRVTDLGTKFSVRATDGNLEVALVEGRARLDSVHTGARPQSANLVPGDVAVATQTSLSVTKKPAQVLAYNLGWRRGLLMFHDTTLADAVAEFNRYNDTKLMIGDRDAARLKINGTFPIHDVAVFAHVTRDVFGLHVVSSADGTVISR